MTRLSRTRQEKQTRVQIRVNNETHGAPSRQPCARWASATCAGRPRWASTNEYCRNTCRAQSHPSDTAARDAADRLRLKRGHTVTRPLLAESRRAACNAQNTRETRTDTPFGSGKTHSCSRHTSCPARHEPLSICACRFKRFPVQDAEDGTCFPLGAESHSRGSRLLCARQVACDSEADESSCEDRYVTFSHVQSLQHCTVTFITRHAWLKTRIVCPTKTLHHPARHVSCLDTRSTQHLHSVLPSSLTLAPRLAVTSLTHCEDLPPPQERGSSPELHLPT